MTTAAGGAFQPTLWSVVLRAKDPDDPHRRTALNRLLEVYWAPVYVFLRHKGHSPEDAQDATQGFFAHFIELEALGRVDRNKGRFRNYLLALLNHYLANERRKAFAEKRGGRRAPASLDFQRAETEVKFEPADPRKPEDAFRRSWSLSVLESAFDRLRREFEEKGRAAEFEAVKSHLLAAAARPKHQAIAQRLAISLTDVANLLVRSRARLRENIRAILREAVDSDAELEDEMRDFFASFE
ncbi:MAG TPA: sigma-70 family RNA polymerase sigma factor [Planctomycetota bacterium]|nr:sigma-70 family RNA polymerase sigma factor [Planctomycetota bacterium]